MIPRRQVDTCLDRADLIKLLCVVELLFACVFLWSSCRCVVAGNLGTCRLVCHTRPYILMLGLQCATCFFGRDHRHSVSGSSASCCVICLEEYESGDPIRILPVGSVLVVIVRVLFYHDEKLCCCASGKWCAR